MSDYFRLLNQNKTEVLILGPESVSNNIKRSLGPLASNIKLASKNLGVLFDHYMNFEGHIKRVVQSCFSQLRNIAKIRNVYALKIWKRLCMFLFLHILTIVIHYFKPLLCLLAPVGTKCSGQAFNQNWTQSIYHANVSQSALAIHRVQN